MAVLMRRWIRGMDRRRRAAGSGGLRLRLRQAVAGIVLVGIMLGGHGYRAKANDYPEGAIKAVFLYHFTHFVDWPPHAFSDGDAAFVIGILGNNPFGRHLPEAVGREVVNKRPVALRYYDHVSEVGFCHILYISASENEREVLRRLGQRPILTVSDSSRFVEQGGCVQFARKDGRVHLRINQQAVQEAGLTISSKLLRVAEVYPAGKCEP